MNQCQAKSVRWHGIAMEDSVHIAGPHSLTRIFDGLALCSQESKVSSVGTLRHRSDFVDVQADLNLQRVDMSIYVPLVLSRIIMVNLSNYQR